MQRETHRVQSSRLNAGKLETADRPWRRHWVPGSSFSLPQRQAPSPGTQKTKTLQVVHFRSFPVLNPWESMKFVQSGARTWLRWPLRLVAASSLPLPKDALHGFVVLTGKVSHFYLSFLRVWLKASPPTTFLPPGSSFVASHKDILSLPLMAITTCPAGSPAPSTKSDVAACPPVRWMRQLWVQGFWRPLFTCTSDRSRVKSVPPVFFRGSRPLLRIWS